MKTVNDDTKRAHERITGLEVMFFKHLYNIGPGAYAEPVKISFAIIKGVEA